MTLLAHIEVHGTPVPQGSKTAFVRGGHAVVTEGKGPGRENHAAWRQAVATAARDWQDQHRQPLFDEPLSVRLTFRLHRPKSVSVTRRPYPAVKPDLDKLERAVLDALTGVVLVDDALVVDLHSIKRYADGGPPGCEIRIGRLEAAS